MVDIYAKPGHPRDPVMIIEKYVSLLPSNRKNNTFYVHCKKSFSDGVWYLDTPVGVNKLQSMVSDMVKKAGIPGRFTNHSLRATAATRLYHANVDEQIIQEITGHRSLAVRAYKRTSMKQKEFVSQCVHALNTEVLVREDPSSKRRKIDFTQ